MRPRTVLTLSGSLRKASLNTAMLRMAASGVMKNALDWMVGSDVFVAKPVVLWNASPRATHALAALRETLTVMSARLIEPASLELLIRPPEDGSSPINPDPHAMRRSLLLLRNLLREE